MAHEGDPASTFLNPTLARRRIGPVALSFLFWASMQAFPRGFLVQDPVKKPQK